MRSDVLLSLAGVAALSLAQPPRREGGAAVPSPEQQARLAVADLEGMPREDRPFTRYLSFWAAAPRQRERYRRLASWWCHQMTFERALAVPRQVGGSEGVLVRLDLRDYGWSPEAWRAVASRDPSARQPGVTASTAEALRKLVGEEAISTKPADSYPLVGVVNGIWFVRETMESNRSPSYYDLLFSRQRFGEVLEAPRPLGAWRTETKTINHNGGDYVYPDDSGRVNRNVPAGLYRVELRFKVKDEPARVKFKDFPADEDDWDKAFGLDKIKSFGREQKIDLDFGAVVAGGRDDPDGGSIVALNNRLIVVLTTPFGRPAMKTFDAKETSGKKDYAETLIFAGGRFKRGDGAKAVSDGGELLAYLPNGGLAGLLVNAEGKRVELAAADLANDTADRRLNPGVRNPGSCHVCHGPSGGFIPPKDVIKAGLEGGIDVKFRDRQQRNRLRAFFLDWDEQIQGYQRPYEVLAGKATAEPGDAPGAARWEGADVARALADLRDDYDGPLNAEAAARELGVPEDGLRWLAVRSTRNRAQQLVRGQRIPRSAWDKDLLPELQLRLDVSRADPGFKQWAPK